MRVAAALVLVVAQLAPVAVALCAGPVCVADESYRDASPACNGTAHLTGAWILTSEAYLYAWGERRDCASAWGPAGGSGLRAGVVVLGEEEVEARWYEHAERGCETSVEAVRFHAGGPCLAPPPPVAWGNVLP